MNVPFVDLKLYSESLSALLQTCSEENAHCILFKK